MSTDNKDEKAQQNETENVDQKTQQQQELESAVEKVQLQANEAFQKLPLLGPVAWLYGESKGHQNYFLNDLSWLVMPALITNQYKLYLKQDAPIAFISWALINDEVANRIKTSNQLRITPSEWQCGDQVWIIDVVAPFTGLEGVMKDLRNNVFPDKDIHMYMPAVPGQSEGKVIKYASQKVDDKKTVDEQKVTSMEQNTTKH